MNETRPIVQMIDARNKQQDGNIKYRSVENDAGIMANTTGVKALSIDWSQSKVSHVEVNILLTGQASQALKLTGYWQLDNSNVSYPIMQTIQPGFSTIHADFLLNAITSEKHVLDFFLRTDSGTFSIDSFGAKMYIASSGITNAGEVLPKIKVTEIFVPVSISFSTTIGLASMTDNLGVTVATQTPIPLAIQETFTGASISFVAPSIGLSSLTENLNIALR